MLFRSCNDFGTDNLMAHLEIMANRIATGSTIHGDDESSDEETSVRALHASNVICDLISTKLGIAIDSAERAYLALVIDTNAQSLEIQADECPESSSISPLDLRIARESAEQLAWNYCLEGFSEEFIQRLAAHIHLLRRRAFHGMEVPNPLAHRVKADYPLIYDMAVKIANIIEKSTEIAVSENEIAFLAFHVGGYLSHSSQQQNPFNMSLFTMSIMGFRSTLSIECARLLVIAPT